MFDFGVAMLMLRLDVGTLAFSTALVAFAVALTIAFIGRRQLKGLPWGEFAGSCALYGTGLVVIVFPPGDSPGVSVVGGNILATMSTVLAHAGVARLVKRPGFSLWAYCLAILSAASGFILAYSLDYSVALVSAIRLPFYIHAVILIVAEGRRLPKGGLGVLAATFVAWTALVGGRVVSIVFAELGELDFGGSTITQAVYFASFGPTFVALCIALLQIRFEREEAILNDKIDEQTKALRKSKEVAEDALATKSRFLAATSHDLRQAVHTLRLLMSEAREEVSAPGHGEIELAEMMGDMGKVIDGMTEQLNALLDMARLDAGTVKPSIRECVLQNVFERIERQFERIAASSGVDLTIVPTSCVAQTDPALLARVIANLVSNAIKFSPDGRVLLGCRRRDRGVEIMVCDDGIGIPDGQITEVFEEYKQIHNDARQRSKGLGLGLAIVKRTADLLGHHVKVKSSLGKGSAFSIFIPRQLNAPRLG